MKLFFYSSSSNKAKYIHKILTDRFRKNICRSPEHADYLISIGGDGTILRLLRENYNKPIYPINGGSVGFLANHVNPNINLIQHIKKATAFDLFPLIANINGDDYFAFNEIVVMRETAQSAKLEISINDNIVYPELICDGVIIATPCGSTGYNISAGGPILPLDSKLLTLTPICPFRPRGATSTLLNNTVKIAIKNAEDTGKRPIKIGFDGYEYHVQQGEQIKIYTSVNKQTLLLDKDSMYRIFMENFN